MGDWSNIAKPIQSKKFIIFPHNSMAEVSPQEDGQTSQRYMMLLVPTHIETVEYSMCSTTT